MNNNNPTAKQVEKFFAKHLKNSDVHLDIEFIANPSPEYISFFFSNLANHPRYEELKGDFIYDPDLKMFAHIIGRSPIDENRDDHDPYYFYSIFMSEEEVTQIENVTNAKEYLLKYRADQVVQNPRLKRVFAMLKKKYGYRWSFSKYFDTQLYRKYLALLKEQRKQQCRDVPHGTIHSNEANGMCLKTPFGNIIVLSYSLRHFLYYMNVHMYGEQLGVDEADTFRAFLLSIRLMFGTESLDFELDPRGKLPKAIDREINILTDYQMKFIIGHEYAHHYLGHLNKRAKLNATDKITDNETPAKIYSYSQQNEFAADLHAVIEPKLPPSERALLLNAAIVFFFGLYLYQGVEDYLFPKISRPPSHPSPLERIAELRKSVSAETGFTEEEIQKYRDRFESFLNGFLTDYLPFNVDIIENTGSIYLESYRKKKLIDRLDF